MPEAPAGPERGAGIPGATVTDGLPPIARRAARIAPFEVMEVVRAARLLDDAQQTVGGAPVCHLEVGQPSAGPPPAALAAVRDLVGRPDGGRDLLGYSDALGRASLRRRIATWYLDQYGEHVNADRIAVTTGASAGCVLAFLACFDPGARVAVCEPGYPCYRNIGEVLGLEMVRIQVGQGTRYQPTPDLLDEVAATGALDGLVLASPSNPTGAMLDDDELTALADWCRTNGVRMVADEIYHGITSGRPAPTALAHLDSAVVVQSASKYLRMPGWRLGWLVLPDELLRPVERLAQNLYLAPPSLAQVAAEAAFEDVADLDAEVVRYGRNRDLLRSGLEAAGISDIAPAEGAFYLWADFAPVLATGAGDHGPADASALCSTWLHDLGVAATPGGDFDRVGGSTFVRFSIAGSDDEIATATDRLTTWLEARHRNNGHRR